VTVGRPIWVGAGHNGVAVTSSKYKSAGPFGLSAVLAAAGIALALVGQAAGQPVAQPQAGQVQPVQPQPVNQPPTVASPAAGAVAPSSSPTAAAEPASGSGPPPQPPPPQKRGFLNDFGKWWDESIANFNAKMKEQQDKIDESNKKSSEAMKEAAAATQQAMKNAADAMVHLGTSKMIEVHEVCAIAGNGAPDCQAAAINACRGKGFGGGAPLDIRTAEKCNASLWVSGQAPTPGNCPVETVVLRAACQ
jgi:hypothetical protein